MKKKYKLLLSSIGLFSIAAVTIASVVSCSNDSNNNSNSAKNASNSSSSSSSSSSNSNNTNNEPSNNSSSLTTKEIINDVATYLNNQTNQSNLLTYLISQGYLVYSNQNTTTTIEIPHNNSSTSLDSSTNTSLTYGQNYSSLTSALTDGLQRFLINFPISSISLTKSEISNLQITTNAQTISNNSFYFEITSLSSTKQTSTQSIEISSQVLSQVNSNITNLPSYIINFLNSSTGKEGLIQYLLATNYIAKKDNAWIFNNTQWLINQNNFFEIILFYLLGDSNVPSYMKYVLYPYLANSSTSSLVFNVNCTLNNSLNNLTIAINLQTNQQNISKQINIDLSSTNMDSLSQNFYSSFTDALENYFNDSSNQMNLLKILVTSGILVCQNNEVEFNKKANNADILTGLTSSINYFFGIIVNNNYYWFRSISNSTSNSLINLSNVQIINNELTFNITPFYSTSSFTVNINLSSLQSSIESFATYVNNEFTNSNFQNTFISFLVQNVSNLNLNQLSVQDLGSAIWETLLYFNSSSVSYNFLYYYNFLTGDSIPNFVYWYIGWNPIISNITFNSGKLTFLFSIGSINFNTISIEIGSNNGSLQTTAQNLANNITSYLMNNQTLFINYLAMNGYLTYSSSKTWTLASSYDDLSLGVQEYIESSNKYTQDANAINIINQTENGSTLTFTIQIAGVSATSAVTITITNIESSSLVNNAQTAANNLASYLMNNQTSFLKSLATNGYLTYSSINQTWALSNSNELSSGIQQYLEYSDNEYSQYSNAITLANNSLDGDTLTFMIQIAGISATSAVTITITNKISSDVVNSVQTLANIFTTYIMNNQTSFLDYLVTNGYLTYSSSKTWLLSESNGLTFGVQQYLNDNINEYSQDTNAISLINTTLNNNVLTFTIQIAGISATSTLTITINSTESSSLVNNAQTIANNITSYLMKNQETFISYLTSNDYLSYSSSTKTWTLSNSNNLVYAIEAYLESLNSGYSQDTNAISLINTSLNDNILRFTIQIAGISANSAVTITINSTESSSLVHNAQTIANNITTYLMNNETSLLNYLIANDYFTYSSSKTWVLSDSNELVSGIQQYLEANDKTYSRYNITIDPTTPSSNDNTLTFTIQIAGVNATSAVTIKFTNKISSDLVNKEQSIANSFTSYLMNNQQAFLKYLENNNYLTYSSTKTWVLSDSNELVSGIQQYLETNYNEHSQNISLITLTNLSLTNNILMFTIQIIGVSATNAVTITINSTESSGLVNNAQTIANNITSYLMNNQTLFLEHLANNGYLIYSTANKTWVLSGPSTWFIYGIKGYLNSNNEYSKYDIEINPTTPSLNNDILTFTIQFAGVSATSVVTITITNTMSSSLFNNAQTIANSFTSYLMNNQTSFLEYLTNNGYLIYSAVTKTWALSYPSGLIDWIEGYLQNTNNQYSQYANLITAITPSAPSITNGALTFVIQFAGVSATSAATISISNTISSSLFNNAQTIANSFTSYLMNNQTSFLEYLANDGYLTYASSTKTWILSNYSELIYGIQQYIENNNISQYSQDASSITAITPSTPSLNNGTLTFTIQSAGVSATSQVKISNITIQNS